MAMVSAVPAPHVRGTFMTLVSSVQMLSSGLATLVAGLIITRVPNGPIAHYNTVGYIAIACGIASIWIARRLRTKPTTPTTSIAAEEAPV